jgi:hypothetical protein
MYCCWAQHHNKVCKLVSLRLILNGQQAWRLQSLLLRALLKAAS